MRQTWYDHLRTDYEQGFPAYCGIEVVRVDRGLFETRLTIEDRHRQQDGFVHAGVIATMADHTAGYAAYTILSENERVLTVEYKINFLKPANGSVLVCRSQVLSGGKTLIVAESSVVSRRPGREKLVGKAQVTLMAVAAEKLAR